MHISRRGAAARRRLAAGAGRSSRRHHHLEVHAVHSLPFRPLVRAGVNRGAGELPGHLTANRASAWQFPTATVARD